MLIVMCMVAAIGWVDYVSGIWVSLQLFYLIPIMLSVAWLGWREGCVVVALCVLTRMGGDIGAGIFRQIEPIAVFWNRLVDLGVSCILVWAFHTLISLQRQLEARVRTRTAALELAVAARNHMQAQLMEVSRRERGAIGHDLHDGLGQHLTATAMAAEVLAARLKARDDASSGDARTIVRLVEEGIAQTRHLARGLLLSTIEPEQLVLELEELCASASREQHVPCTFSVDGTSRISDPATASHLFYIAREAVHNALRHAGATQVAVSLTADSSSIALTVTDDGCGLPPRAVLNTGMGLRIMAHRSELIGAEFSVTPAPGGGTLMRCLMRLPLLPAPQTVVVDSFP